MAGGNGFRTLIAAQPHERGEVLATEEGGRTGGLAVVAEDYRGFFFEVLAEEAWSDERLVREEDEEGVEVGGKFEEVGDSGGEGAAHAFLPAGMDEGLDAVHVRCL